MKNIPVFLGALILALAPASTALAQEVAFKSHGKAVKNLVQDALEGLVPTAKLEVYDPNSRQNAEYVGFSFQALLDKVYGPTWKNAEEILFTCADGYQPSIPMQVFRAYPAMLAFKRQSGPFNLVNKLHGSETIELGPYYLVWDDLKHPKVKEEGESVWPYQLVGVDLVSFVERFKNIAPPGKAPLTAKRGFLTFRKYCLSCHTINGEGGTKGVELNYPVNVTQYYREEWLRKWISNPRGIRFSTIMPGLSADAANREAQLTDVIAYLKAMAKNKIAPKVEAK